MKYLVGIRTLEQLKKEYHAWALKLHPDMGGSTEAMQELNNEYDSLFQTVKDVHLNKEGKEYRKETNEAPEFFKDLIAKLIVLPEIHIEIIGAFVWVSGNTEPIKTALKEMNFRWHSVKQNWYLAPEWYKKYNSKQYTMDEVRGMFGVQYETDSEGRKQLASA